jgi:TPR repeat protein
MLVTAVPILTPGGGAYAEAHPVAISDATPFSTIHYTVDGNTPREASLVYKQPITGLASGSTIRAIATTMWGKPSLEASGVYTWTPATLLKAKPPEPSAYDQGKAAFDNKDYALARVLFTQACDGGEMKACNYLGYVYAQGLGGIPDVDAARKIYQKACEQGNLNSCTSLGTMFQDDQKYTEARKYFKQACDGGVNDACNYLGDLYALGLGGPTDKQKAREIYQKACEQGNLLSCTSLGTLYQNDKKYAEARKYFNQACGGGVNDACNYLGDLYAQDLGGPLDKQKAREIYQKACEQGNLSSCTSLGTMYQDDHKNAEARKYFKQACDGGVKDACKLLHGTQ